jgi:HSP20 family molecular chaperone IbpA
MDGVEIRDGGHEWVVESEMPGVKKGDLEVRVHEGGAEGGKVEVVGRVRKPQSGVEAEKNPEVEHPGESQKSSPSAKGEEGEGQLWRTEFKQTILLPKSMDKLDPGSIKAKLEDGVLTMRITKPPKRNEDTEGVRISVE